MTLKQLQERVNALVNMNQGWKDIDIVNVKDLDLCHLKDNGLILTLSNKEPKRYYFHENNQMVKT